MAVWIVFWLPKDGREICPFCNRPDVQLFNNNWNLAAPSELGAGEPAGWQLIMMCVYWFFDWDMEEKDLGRKRIIGLRLNKEEFDKLEEGWKQSTLKKLSEYVRRVLFGKRITVYSRSRSLDELVAELVVLKKELNAIGVNFNQAVHRLNMLDHSPQMQAWVERFGRDRDRFFVTLDEVRDKINQVSEQWLQ